MAKANAATPTALRDNITLEPSAYWLSGNPCEKTDVLWSFLKYAPQTWIVTLTSAEIKALATTGIILVPAPGADKFLQIANIAFILNYGSEVLVEPSAPDDLQVVYDDAGGTAAVDVIGDWIIQAQDSIITPAPTALGAAIDAATMVNKQLVLDNVGDDYTGNASNDTTLTVICTVITRDAGLA